MVKTACVVCGRKDMLHRFPSNLKRCTKWLEQCNRLDLLEKGVKCLHQNYRLCRRHFKPWCFSSNVSKCLIRCAHPEIFDVPSIKQEESPTGECDSVVHSRSLFSNEETDFALDCGNEMDVTEEVTVPVPKNTSNLEESHLVIYSNVKELSMSEIICSFFGVPLTPTGNKCLYTVVGNQNQPKKKENYSLLKTSSKVKVIEVGGRKGSNLLPNFQKAKNAFTKFNQKNCLLSNSEMARLCILLVKCKKMVNNMGSFDSAFEELVSGLIYSFQDKFKNKDDQSRFNQLFCELMESEV